MLDDLITAFVLLLITSGVWFTSRRWHGFWKQLYTYVPPVILLYLIPSMLGTLGVMKGGDSAVGKLSLGVMLPVSLLLLTMTINFRDILALSRKSVLIFLAGTAGIIAGGPIALWLVGQSSPALLDDHGPDSVWKGLVCISGSWINGTPGQTSMKEIFGASDELYFIMLAVDTVVQNLWLAFLFLSIRFSGGLDRLLKADKTELHMIQQREFDNGLNDQPQRGHKISGNPFGRGLVFLVLLCAAGYFMIYQLTAFSAEHFLQKSIPETSAWSFLSKASFWQVFYATTLGIILSFTKARQLDKAGATPIGNFLLYFIFSAIGLKMNIFRLGGQWEFVIICVIWLVIHFLFLIAAARLLRGSFFFVAVGSQANIGGPATASMVAGAFNPHLASIGVLLGVLSNVIGNYCGLIAGILYQWVIK
jgi:uncharacterized membrane protein